MSKARLYGGGDDSAGQLLLTPQSKGRKRNWDELAIVEYQSSPGSDRKPQRTLASFWGSPGPQSSVHRSPDHMMKSEQYLQEQSTRKQLAEQQMAKLPGEWLVPVLQRPHTGGRSGGRTAVGPVRGVAAGHKSNRRQLGESVLRRDPGLPEKLAVIAKVDQLASDPTSVPTHVRRQVEKFSGFSWQTVLGWYRRKEEFGQEFGRLRLGKWGLRPFGSCLAQSKKASQSTGARIRKPTQDYQSSVISSLKQWFERERTHGHEVRTSVLKDFYIKFLERQCATCKAQLIHVSQCTARLKEKAQSWGSGLLQSEDQKLALQEASRLAKQQSQLLSDHEKLEDRIKKMGSQSRKTVDNYFSKVLVKICAHLCKPQRKTRLTSDQEAVRVLLTWQSFDRAQYVAVHGSDEELLEQVCNPDQWRRDLKSTVWAMWDHAPVWLLCKGDHKVAFSDKEISAAGQRRRLSKKSKDAAVQFYAALVKPDEEEGVAEAHSKLLQLAKEAKEASELQGHQAPMQS